MCWSNSPPDFLCGEEVAVSPDHLHCAAALEMFVSVRQVWAEPGFHENLSLDLNLQAGASASEVPLVTFTRNLEKQDSLTFELSDEDAELGAQTVNLDVTCLQLNLVPVVLVLPNL